MAKRKLLKMRFGYLTMKLYEKYQQKIFIYLAAFIMFSFYLIFFIVPILEGLTGSFFDWNPLSMQKSFTGLKNYQDMLQSPVFRVALKNTMVFTFFAVLGKTTLAFFLALAINSLGQRMQKIFRSLYFLPVVMPIVAVSIVWKWFYHPRVGLLNSFLLYLGIEQPINWLGTPNLVLPAVIAMSVWKDMGYALVIFIAALLNIPRNLFEAAHIDGASRWQRMCFVILPSIRPTLIFIIITSLIGDFQAFVQIFIMTKGGPGNASSVISYLIYNQAFMDYRFGYASALSVILFLIIIIITLFQYRIMSKEK